MEIVNSIFIQIMNMSWLVTFVIIAVLIVRKLLSRASKTFSYVLWIIVAVRLISPVMIPSEFSLLHFTNQIRQNIENYNLTNNDSQLESSMVNKFVNQVNNEQINTNSSVGKTTEGMMFYYVFVFVWLAGILCMLGYYFLTYVTIMKKVRYATNLKGNIYECEQIVSPFVFGLFNPRIYIPYHLNTKERKYVLLHENYHLKRLDYLIKPIAFLLLSIYWFHPLVWLSFFLMCNDMEMSCDEKVILNANDVDRKDYSLSLLAFATNQRRKLSTPLAFGENNIKHRVKRILNMRKPTTWVSLGAIIIIVIVALFCLTDASIQKPELSVLKENNAKQAQLLYKARNSYVGDNSADLKLLNIIDEIYENNVRYTIELQTAVEPYELTLHLEKPIDKITIKKASILILALIDNCGKVNWDYQENGTMIVNSMTISEANNQLSITNIKEYGQTEEMLRKLIDLLEDRQLD